MSLTSTCRLYRGRDRSLLMEHNALLSEERAGNLVYAFLIDQITHDPGFGKPADGTGRTC